MASLLTTLVIVTNTISGDDIFRLIQNNNDPYASYRSVGSWSGWVTGYRVNEEHNGYLNIGENTFNPKNLNLSYTADTNCTNAYPLFANGRIFCVSSNMLLSYYPQNGSVSFWYLSMGAPSLQNPTFATSGDYSSIFLFSYSSPSLYITSFDAMTGEVKKTTTLPVGTPGSYYGQFAVGTSYGQVYLSSITSNSNSSIFAYNIQMYQFTQSENNIYGTTEVPLLCNNKVIVSGYYAYTNAYNAAPDFEEQWVFPGEGLGYSFGISFPPVCFKNENGYRVIVKPLSTTDYNCYVLNALNGELLSQFECGTLPIFHYNESNGLADIAMIGTGQYHQVVAVQIDGDNIAGKELWFGDGDLDNAFIVKEYFVTLINSNNGVFVRAYNIFNGDVLWEQVFYAIPYGINTVFGGLYDVQGKEEFMVIVRVGNTFYAYIQLMTDD